MTEMFYLAAVVAVVATGMTVTRLNAVHALLYLVVSLLAVAVMFFTVGAPFVAALEAIIYAGAIIVLFVFVVMMLNLGERARAMERRLLSPGMWVGPSILAAVLVGELVYLLSAPALQSPTAAIVGPKQVGITLFGPYLLGVELASMLLMAALVGAFHLGARQETAGRDYGIGTDQQRPAGGRDSVRTGTHRASGAP
jgi:NADH-quinone oxidoreductase subunit J